MRKKCRNSRREVLRNFPAFWALIPLLTVLLLSLASRPGGLLLPACAAPTKPASAGDVPASLPPLTLRTPSDFVEIDKKNGTLFAENADQLEERATLLRIFLPENQAHFYNEGKRHALTRQLAVYTIKNPEGAPFDKESASLLGRVLEEGFLSFDKVSPPTLRDSLALEDTLLQAARNGRNVLLDSRITENLHLFQYQLAYSLMPGHDSTIADDRMVTSLTTIMLLVRGHIVFICASSINRQAPLYDDAAWTRDAAQKYMETLLADNKKN